MFAASTAGNQRGRPFKKAQSGNPAGKHKGSRHRIMLAAENANRWRGRSTYSQSHRARVGDRIGAAQHAANDVGSASIDAIRGPSADGPTGGSHAGHLPHGQRPLEGTPRWCAFWSAQRPRHHRPDDPRQNGGLFLAKQRELRCEGDLL